MDFNPEDYRDVLSVTQTHQLVIADSRVRVANKVERRSHLLRELDPTHRLIAYYRVWTHQSCIPPFKEQHGWEKYAPDGALLDREVRYHEQPPDVLVH